MTWHNADGLYIKFGQNEGRAGTAGQFASVDAGNEHVIEVDINLTSLGTGAAIQSDVVRIPSGFYVKQVEVFVTEAATSGGSATLNVGLIRSDRTTEEDYDGLVAALALASIDAIGDVVTLVQGSTSHGALVGTVLASTAKNSFITADYDTAAYTAGKVKIRVHLVKV
jgi:hypothetical protein